ncbi:hypothetical protein MA16_Dca008865 [Dendrobium catenatum]|uniref:Reverse transcriptase zinc-binding domain-containing protein n=1 Tax=Dendrobium catenatum TaxID=906689 RepID=A0A2I0VUI4_9ASPA|nr:hypothetical protein MA16_Dca008865 [Dendrobium catenatum]
MMFHGGLKTANVLAVRGIFVPSTCSFCQTDMETITHLYFECIYIFDIAKSFFPWMQNIFMRPNYYQVFDNIFDQGFDIKNRNHYLLIASAMIYFVWRARNDILFDGIIDSKAIIISKIKKAVLIKALKWKK